jgi:hypothetical protein
VLLNSYAMRNRLLGLEKKKYSKWITNDTHPDYERWLHGSPDDNGNKIVPPEDIDKWIYASPTRYFGGPLVKRKLG